MEILEIKLIGDSVYEKIIYIKVLVRLNIFADQLVCAVT